MDDKTHQTVGKIVKQSKQEVHNKKNQTKSYDSMKFILAILLVVGGVYSYYAFDKILNGYLSVVFPVIGVVLAALIVFYWSSLGRGLRSYFRESLSELRKVVTPKRDEVIRTTFFVMLFVGVLALFIWGVDSLISWLFFDVFMNRS